MFAFVRKFGAALLLVFLILFGFQNLAALSQTARFELNLYVPGWVFVGPPLPLVFLLVACFLLGMIAAGFQGFYEKLARYVDIRSRDRRIRALEKEVAALHAQLDALQPQATEGAGAAPAAAPLLEDSPTL